MYKFINKEGIMAYSILHKAVVDTMASYVGAANKCRAGMAKADPMSVCGRVNRHKTMGSGGFFLPSSS